MKAARVERVERWSLSLVRETVDAPGGQIAGPAAVARLFRELYGDAPNEIAVAFVLNARNAVVAVHTVSTGLVDASLMHPREVFRAAIVGNGSAVILAHNHPSGDVTPSPEDRAVTRQLADAGRAVGIPILDHVIVGPDSFTSLQDDNPSLFSRRDR